ncbi:MAG: hypothetical protein EAZ92_15540 [Candidatus Kapaibacterium sp.]|nr:MAG: hypothetical protein EAZ92_15540 [Candidatus Kapabacteria bacterium]
MNLQHRINNIILIESQHESWKPDNCYPFSVLHPLFELRCGALRLFEKVRAAFPLAQLFAHGRTAHISSFGARFPDVLTPTSDFHAERGTLLLQANMLLSSNVCEQILHAIHHEHHQAETAPILVFMPPRSVGTLPCAVYFPPESCAPSVSIEAFCAHEESGTGHFGESAVLKRLAERDIQTLDVENVTIIRYLWDAIAHSAEAIKDDARFFVMNASERLSGFQGVYALAPENIYIGENTAIAPLVVIDARKGAVIIGANVEIQPHCTIIGPCAIADNAVLKANTRLYEGTALGEYSKVAGELKNTIFQSFGNKQHEGCLGYSFIGEWVNLGAGTDVSDLKNNYSTIRVRFAADKSNEIHTGTRSLGLLAGCHTKSAINTSFNTGTVTGVGANVFEAKPDKYVAPFSWGGLPDSPRFDEEKAIQLAQTVMLRRNRVLFPEEEHLLRAAFHGTKK